MAQSEYDPLAGMGPPDPPEGWEGETHWPRPCRGHFHVTSAGMDLIGGKCDTEEEAAEKCRRLNEGEDPDEVLGSIADRLFPWTTRRARGDGEVGDG